MSHNGEILLKLVDEDFGVKGKGRWPKSEEHSSLVVDFDRGIFFWNSQEIVGDPLVYLTRVRNYSFEDAKNYLKNLDYSGTHVYTIKKKGEDDVVVYPKLVEVFQDLGRENREYFYRRGLTDETIDRYQLGWYNEWNTVPFFEDGTFKNFQMRRDKPAKRMKSYYKGVGALMYNSDILKLVDEIYWVEGPVDALVLLQNKIPAISTNCGGGYLPEWYGRFVNIKKINFVFDNDKAGVSEAKKLSKFFGELRCKIYTFEDFEEERYDPVDYFNDGHSGDEFLEMVKKGGKYLYEL